VAELPTGTVTFLFTDIEGSTRLVKQLGDRYAGVLFTHQTLLRAAFAEHGGHEVDTQGDSFFVAFPHPRDAVRAAVDAQRALAANAWPDGAEVRVRMGIHTGVPEVSEGAYTGLAVHRAARIAAAAHGGQVVVSQATEALVDDEAGRLGIRLRDLGEQRLKDLDRPVRVYQLEADGLRTDFPPLRTLDVEERRRRRRRAALVAGLVLVLAAAVAGVLLARAGGNAATARPNSVAVIDPGANRLIRAVAVGRTPTSIAYGEGAVWVLNSGEQTVSRLDPKTGDVQRTDRAPEGATELAVGAGSLWIGTNHLTVARIDPQSALPKPTVLLPDAANVGGEAARVAADRRTAWAGAPGAVVRLDRQSPTRADDPFCCGAVAIGPTAVWATDTQGVLKVDRRTGKRKDHADLEFFGGHVAAGATGVWVTNSTSDKVWRIDPRTLGVRDVVAVGPNPAGVAIGAGSVWVASSDGAVYRIDPDSDRVVATVEVGGTPNAVVVGGGRVWVTVD
jgi:YVTN family beta-propeller protein